MTRIKNKEKILIKDNPVPEDYFPASDSENGGKTINIKLGNLVGYSAVGGFNYDDLQTRANPISYISGDLQLTNDTLGVRTFTTQPPYNVTNVWDELTNTFNFEQLKLGDEFFLRVNLEVTTSTINQISSFFILFGEGTVDEVKQPIFIETHNDTVGLHQLTFSYNFSISNENWRITPAKLLYSSDYSASIVVNGWHPYIIRKNINVVDFYDISATHYKGEFDASILSPTLSSSTSLFGDEYKVINADSGSTVDFGLGSTTLYTNDIIRHDGIDFYVKTRGTSVAGLRGIITKTALLSALNLESILEAPTDDAPYVRQGSAWVRALEVNIQGFSVSTIGKTTFTNLEVGDKFSGWDGDRYVVGKVLNATAILPTDLDDETKIKLVTDKTINPF